MMNKSLLLPIAALLIVGTAGAVGLTKVYAEEQADTFPPMIQRLVEKFNLNQEDVNNFLDEERSARQVQRRADMENRLTEAVSEGKISEDQKNTIMQKIEEHQSEASDLSWQERHEYMEEHRDEMKQWAEESGINLWELGLGKKGFGHKGFWAGGQQN